MASAESTRAIPESGSARESGGRRLADPAAIVAFGLPAGAVLLYALRGGSYDLVIRQELGVAVWWILLLGLVTGVLPRAKPHRLAAVPTLGVVALVAVMALGLTYTESDERTVNELARVLHYGGILALSLCAHRRAGPGGRRRPGLASGAVLVSLLALGSRLFPGLYPARRRRPGVSEHAPPISAQLLERRRGVHRDGRDAGLGTQRARAIAGCARARARTGSGGDRRRPISPMRAAGSWR